MNLVSPGVTRAIKVNDRIFRTVLITQTAVLAIAVLAFSYLFSESTRHQESQVITQTFERLEGDLTEGVYIAEVMSRSESTIQSLESFKKSLSRQGIRAEVRLTPCSQTKFGLVYPLHLGDRQLPKCVEVELHSKVFHQTLLFFSGALLLSILFAGTLWFAYRRSIHKNVLLPLVTEIEEKSADAASWELAKRVAHDIRSPAAALKVVASSSRHLPDQERELLRAAANKISAIASDLLHKKRQKSLTAPAPEQQITSVQSVIESSINELEAKTSKKTQVRREFSQDSFLCFVQASDIELQRVISNLLSNAEEALPQKGGKITVSLAKRDGQIAIQISDNGCGMIPEVLSRAFEKGFTSGKELGTGLGLSMVKQFIESLGGSIAIKSKENAGTSIEMTFQSAEAPNWLPRELTLKANAPVAITDDEFTIHQVWKRRLGKQHELKHFYSPQALRDFVANEAEPGTIHFVDYQLSATDANGVELIRSLGIQDDAILVTGMAWEPKVQVACQEMGLKVLPKEFLDQVPIVEA